MNEVFISYSRQDKAFVQRLDAALRAEGRDPWVDWEDIPLTADWWAAIQAGIEGADSFVFVVSPDSAASEVCGQEVAHAEEHNKRIVPIIYRDVSPKDLPKALTHLNWVFCRESDDFEAAFKALMEAMDTDLEWVKAHTRLTQRAVEWDRKNRDQSYLLRGVDLEEAEDRLGQSNKQPGLTNLQIEYILSSRQNQEVERQKEIEAQKQRRAARRRIMMMGGLIFLVLLIVALSYIGNVPATEAINRTGDVRVPTALVASWADANLRSMVSDVQGYLALGEEQYRQSYNESRQAFEVNLDELTAMSSALSPENQERLAELEASFKAWAALPEQLFALRNDRFEREPAYRLFVTDGRIAAGLMLFDAQSLREEITVGEPTPENLELSADLSDFISSFQAMEAALSGYVNTRDRNFRQEYETHLESNQFALERLQDRQQAFTPAQQEILDSVTENRDSFLLLADEMFEIVESDRWREDLYLFSTEAVPLADKMGELLAELTDDQQNLLQQDLNRGRIGLSKANQQALVAGLVAIMLGFGMVVIELWGPGLKAGMQSAQDGSLNRLVNRLGRPYVVGILLLLVVSLGAMIVLYVNTASTETASQNTDIGTGNVATDSPTAGMRGMGDTLRLLSWQAPQRLNPHLTVSDRDWTASRITYEPLASFDQEGNLIPILAADIPSLENGDVAADGTSVIWRLKEGIKWSDGEPFTAHDVLFTYEFITNPEVNSSSSSNYEQVESIDIIDDLTVKVNFKEANPTWYQPFVGVQGMIIPQHLFAAYNGSNAREAPANSVPVGTGPYRVVPPGIKPQGVLYLGTELIQTTKILFEPNPYFREADKPYFSQIELLGGSVEKEAARSVLQFGYADFAWNMTLDGETIARLEEGGNGEAMPNYENRVQVLALNLTDPKQATESGEQSSIENPHPILSDSRVRRALSYAIDREATADVFAKVYGPAQRPTGNILVAPPIYASPNTHVEYNLDKATALLDEAGWRDSNGDGIRDKDGVDLTLVLATSENPLYQQTQAFIQDSLEAIGIEVELKIVESSIFFGDSSNPDSIQRFNADIQLFSFGSGSFDPADYLRNWRCDQIPQEANGWRGNNIERFCDPVYDMLTEQAAHEFDPERRKELFIELNDLLVNEGVVIPLLQSPQIHGVANTLEGVELTPWDANTWNIKEWRRESP